MKIISYFVQAMLPKGHALLAQAALTRVAVLEKDGRIGWRIPIAGRSISGNPAKVLQRITGFELAQCSFLLALESGLQPKVRQIEPNLQEHLYGLADDKIVYIVFRCTDEFGKDFYLVDGIKTRDRFCEVFADYLTEQIDAEHRSKVMTVTLPVHDLRVYRVGCAEVSLFRKNGQIYSNHADVGYRVLFKSGVPECFFGYAEWVISPQTVARIERAEKYERRKNENKRHCQTVCAGRRQPALVSRAGVVGGGRI